MREDILTSERGPVQGAIGDASAPPTIEPKPVRPWRQATIAAVVVWIGSHVGYLVVNLLAWRVGRLPDPDGLRNPLTLWYRWDVGHFVRIAEVGYTEPGSYAFFPLYPMLTKAANYILPGSAWSAAMAVSNVACLGALVMLHRLTARELDSAAAERTLYYLIAFPTAFFLSAPYNTSLYVLLVAGFLYLVREGRWWWAAAVGALATATRSSAVLLLLPFLYEYLRQRGFKIRLIRWDILAAVGILGGIAAFSAYCWHVFGDPLAYVHAQEFWGRFTQWPWEPIYAAILQVARLPVLSWYWIANLQDLLAALAILTLLTLAVVGRWRFRSDQRYLIIFGFAVTLFPLTSGVNWGEPIVSMPRHVLEALPAFMVLAKIGASRHAERLYLLSAVMAQAVLLAIYLGGGWIA